MDHNSWPNPIVPARDASEGNGADASVADIWHRVQTREELEREIVKLRGEVAELLAIGDAQDMQITNLAAELKHALETLEASECWRRAYQAGKYQMYSMGGEVQAAAMAHLPCNEGALDRRFTKLIELPRIKAVEAERDALTAELKAAKGALESIAEDKRRRLTTYNDVTVCFWCGSLYLDHRDTCPTAIARKALRRE